MAGLKELRNRLESIKSTQKITSAMKLVAASRLRKAQLMLDKSRYYADQIEISVKRVLAAIREEEAEQKIVFLPPMLLRQKPNAKNYLLFVFASDRGLCGSYNQNIGKAAIGRIKELEAEGKNVQIICYGKKGFDILKKKHADKIIGKYPAVAAKNLSYGEAIEMARDIQRCCESGSCDVCEVVYSHFRSAISRDIISQQIYPLSHEIADLSDDDKQLTHIGDAYYDFTPDKKELLDTLLPKLVMSRLFSAMVNSQASEQGARMAAMDNATRNAKDMISNLTLKYNSIRQSAITTELTEIISGAEAL